MSADMSIHRSMADDVLGDAMLDEVTPDNLLEFGIAIPT